MLDIFFHPVGWACSAIWFVFWVWVAIKAYYWFFPPKPPAG